MFGAASAITVNAPGILDLGGNNQQIGSLTGSGNVTNTGLSGAVLTTGDTGITSFSGVIQDGTSATGLTKQGTGTFTLPGINTYTGATTVNAGTLEVDGSVALSSGLTINAGGTLAGTGTVASTTINGGTLSPGDGVGTITVAGNLAFTAGSTYLVDVSPTTSDRTDVSGTASLNGTTQATFEAGSYIERTYTILSATGGRSGVFDSLMTTGLPGGFSASLSYTATDAILNLTATLGPPGGSGQLPRNPANVATTLNDFFNNGGALPPNFVTVFGLTGTDLRDALNQLSGEAATGSQQGAFQLSNQFLELMLDPFVDGRRGFPGAVGRALGFAQERDAQHAGESVLKGSIYNPIPTKRWSVWGGAFGGYNRTDGDSDVIDSHDLRSQAGSVAVGLDYRLSPDTVAGFALAGGATDWNLADGLGGGKSDAFQAGIYGATRTGPAYLATAFAYANHQMSTDRFAFGGNHLGASFNAHSFGARLEGGYRIGDAASAVAPYVAIQALRFLTPSYAETDIDGGGFGLNYASHKADNVRSELGVRFDHEMQRGNNAVLTLRGKIAWAHDWVSNPTRVVAFQGLPGGGSFVVTGASTAQNSLLVSVGPELRFANGITFAGKFDGEFSGRSNTYAGTGTFSVRW